jgi:hypothetical protein
MSDVILAALFSSAGAALVAIAGAVASIFGPAWRERDARRDELSRASDDLRYSRATDFVEEFAAYTSAQLWADTVRLHRTRNRFVATLRSGEGAAAEYLSRQIDRAKQEAKGPSRMDVVNQTSDDLFSWLRGELAVEDLLTPGRLERS